MEGDTDRKMVEVQPAKIIKEENVESGDEVADSCCDVKMEEYEWDEHVGSEESNVTDKSYQDAEYVSGHIPYTEDDYASPLSPGGRGKPYFCNFCDYRTNKTSALAQHVRTHTGEKPFACHLCDFRSSTSGSLKRHVRRHTGEKPYPCNECDYRGTSASDLQVHVRTHDSGKSFNCDMCDYRGTTSWNLREHIKTHTGDKPYSCHLCSFRCSASGSLKRHIRRHTGEKPFSCDLCNYKCSCSSDLKVHQLIHLDTDNKPFACKMCDWRGVTNGQLKLHIKSHGKPQFYQCPICGLKAGRINNFRNHMRIHNNQSDIETSGEKVNGGKACNSCQYLAISSGELSAHVATAHAGDNPSAVARLLESADMNEVVAAKREEPSREPTDPHKKKNTDARSPVSAVLVSQPSLPTVTGGS